MPKVVYTRTKCHYPSALCIFGEKVEHDQKVTDYTTIVVETLALNISLICGKLLGNK